MAEGIGDHTKTVHDHELLLHLVRPTVCFVFMPHWLLEIPRGHELRLWSVAVAVPGYLLVIAQVRKAQP